MNIPTDTIVMTIALIAGLLYLKMQKENLSIVIIAIDTAKRVNGNILHETRRYAEYFPKESIKYIDENLKRSIYSKFIDSQKFYYEVFVIYNVFHLIVK